MRLLKFTFIAHILLLLVACPVFSNTFFIADSIDWQSPNDANWEKTELPSFVDRPHDRPFWVKFEPVPKQSVISIENFYFDTECFWWNNGKLVAIEKMERKAKFPSYKLNNTDSAVYFRLTPNALNYLPIVVYTEAELQEVNFENRLFHGVITGGIIVFCLISLILFLLFRQKLYLYFVAYLLSFYLLYLFISGEVLNYFFLNKGILVRFTFLGFVVYFITLLNLAYYIIGFKHKGKKRFGILTATIVLGSIACLFLPVKFGVLYNNFIPLALMIYLYTEAGIKFMRTRSISLVFFIAGWTIYYAACIIMILMNIGVIKYNTLSVNAPYIGILFEAFFFILSIFYSLKQDIQAQSMDLSSFSKREREVVELLVEGVSNKEMSDRLFVSVNTVKFHLGNIYKKTNTTNKKEAIAYFLGRGRQ